MLDFLGAKEVIEERSTRVHEFTVTYINICYLTHLCIAPLAMQLNDQLNIWPQMTNSQTETKTLNQHFCQVIQSVLFMFCCLNLFKDTRFFLIQLKNYDIISCLFYFFLSILSNSMFHVLFFSTGGGEIQFLRKNKKKLVRKMKITENPTLNTNQTQSSID